MIGRAFLATVLALAAVAMSCSSKSARNYGNDLFGTNEVPPVTTNAAGNVSFTLSSDETSMSFVLTITEPIDSAFASHIHLGAPGVNGDVIVPLWTGEQGMGYTGTLRSATLTNADLTGPMAGKTLAALAESIDAGHVYVNVHTKAHPAGEIRGQLQQE